MATEPSTGLAERSVGLRGDWIASITNMAPTAATTLPEVRDRRGWPALHRMHVTQAPEGCDYDFLQARTADQVPFVEPVIGRS